MAKIILIEDEPQIREEVMDWLQYEGFEVTGAVNGRLGLEAINRENPDMILCDIAMPEMNGHEVLIEVRSNTSTSLIPFVFLTASADREAIRRGMDMGADDYLTKPFTHSELLSTIHTRLEKKALLESQTQNQISMLSSAINVEREKLLLKSRLIAMFSHDFRNPLAAILSASGILRNYGDRLTPERQQRHLDRIDGSVHRLMQMLDDMLMVAEVESGHLDFKPQTVDLPAFVTEIIEEFHLIDQEAHKLNFENTLEGEVKADPKLLRQILANLISNALKYSPSGTEVTVTMTEDKGCICFKVEDHGLGIPEDSLPLLFEPFHRASNVEKIKGTGLGLTIVKECVEHHNGTIEVSSQLGEGTTFAVQLPLVRS